MKSESLPSNRRQPDHTELRTGCQMSAKAHSKLPLARAGDGHSHQTSRTRPTAQPDFARLAKWIPGSVTFGAETDAAGEVQTQVDAPTRFRSSRESESSLAQLRS